MTADRRSKTLATSQQIAVYDVTCDAPRSGFGGREVSSVIQLVLPRRGLFMVETDGREIVAHPGRAFLLGPQDEYRVSHPGDQGDACTVIVATDAVLEEAFGAITNASRDLEPRQQLVVQLLGSSLRGGHANELEAEEMALLMLESAAQAFSPRRIRKGHGLGARRVARVDHVSALLAANPTFPWRLETVAQAAGCTPFHLARDFRAHTGATLGGYLLRLRLGLAVDRLAEGEDNLAVLAVETGFAHHSHFTARFQRVFGLTPSRARRNLTNSRLQALREYLMELPAPN